MTLPDDLPWLGAVALALLAAGAVASAAQISARAVGTERAQELVDKGGSGRMLRLWLADPLRFLLATLQWRLVGVSGAALAAAMEASHHLSHPWAPWWAAAGVMLAHLVLVEVLLCTWAKHRARTMAGVWLASFSVLEMVAWPITRVLRALASRWAGSLTGRDEQAVRSGPFLTEEDMERVWGLTPEAGQPENPEHRLLQGVLDFTEAVVRDVMVPRTRIASLDVDAHGEDVLKAFASHGHTRLLVCQQSLDKVVGVLFLTDVVRQRAAGAEINLRAVMRRPYFVPELMKVMDLLREFQRRRTHLAVVVDEFGTTSGMVTLQDVVEEIVGDVRDEDDAPDASVREVKPGLWMMDARTPMDAASKALGVELPHSGAYETLGGYLISQLGRLPISGAVVRREGLLFTVKDADEKRITRLQVERDPTVPSGSNRNGSQGPTPRN